MKQDNGKKGFTLIELIIVIGILAVLAGVLIPSMVSYMAESQKTVCQSNQLAVERQYLYQKGIDPDVTLDEVLDGDYDSFVTNVRENGCPAHGVYSVSTENPEKVVCSIEAHNFDADSGGDTPDPGGDPGGGGNTYPDTGVPLDTFDPDGVELKDGFYYFKPSNIFEYNGKYYVITREGRDNGEGNGGTWYTRVEDGAGGFNFAQLIQEYMVAEVTPGVLYDQSNINWSAGTGGQATGLKYGDIIEWDDGFYVFKDGGAYAYLPPGDNPNAWYKLPG